MSASGVAQFKRFAIRESVAEAVRRTLLAGGYKPGQIISEVAIAAEFEISRGPVREALLTLASEGLLIYNPNRGFAVLSFSVEDIEQIEIVRLALEPLALAASREHASGDDLAQLRELKSELVCAFRAEQQLECVSAELAFHRSIWQLSSNPWLTAGLQRVMMPAFTYGAAFRMTRPNLTAEWMDTIHQLYIDYISGIAAQSAEACVRIHLGLEGAPA
jgi:DNA-binding GntR family transcriptional regulator